MTHKLTPTQRLIIHEIEGKGPRTVGQLIDLTQSGPLYAHKILARLVQGNYLIRHDNTYSIPTPDASSDAI
jgi:DNA-binding MarR family transcriptional regulator